MRLQSDNGTMNTPTNFQEFYSKWKVEQKYQLDDLLTASRSSNQPEPPLSVLVRAVISHYEKYYTIKSKWAETDVLLLLSPPWNSPLEDAFTWVGGWRPTTAFHLLYSKSSLQFEARMSDLCKGIEIGDLGDLSSEQVKLIDKLQRSTINEERDITEKVAKQQERVADMEMVELSHGLSELSLVEDGNAFDTERVESAIKLKEEGFQVILQSADDLRLRTLKAVVDVLSPIQAVHFLIAAAELQMRLHDWGKEKEERQARNRAVS